MASKPSVTLTFAGDSEKLEKAMSRVGGATEDLSRKVQDSGSSYEHLADKSDLVDTRAMGLADSFAGVRDGLAAWNDESMSTGEKMQTLAMAASDLASGFTNFIIPALAETKIGMMAHSVWSGIAAAGTRVWAFAQQMLNLSFWASPIGLITLGIVALVAVIVLIAAKTDWFQRLWGWAWSGIKAVAVDVWNWLQGLPDRLGAAFGRLPGILSAPFRAGFNLVSDAWNNTVGRLSWTVPGWVPGLGGQSISAPRLPRFHTGGVVPGMPGQEVLAVLQAGERVTPAGQGSGELRLVLGGDTTGAVAELINYLIRIGQIQIATT